MVGAGEASAEFSALARGLGALLFHPSGQFFGFVADGPDVAEEIGGVDVAIFLKEIAISTAAEHQIGIKLAPELRFCFLQDSWEIGNSFEFLAKTGNVVTGEDLVAFFAFLKGQEIVASDGGDQQGGGGARFAFFGEVFDEIEKLAWLVADRFEKFDVFAGIVVFKIRVSRAIGFEGAGEKFGEAVVPGHVGFNEA